MSQPMSGLQSTGGPPPQPMSYPMQSPMYPPMQSPYGYGGAMGGGKGIQPMQSPYGYGGQMGGGKGMQPGYGMYGGSPFQSQPMGGKGGFSSPSPYGQPFQQPSFGQTPGNAKGMQPMQSNGMPNFAAKGAPQSPTLQPSLPTPYRAIAIPNDTPPGSLGPATGLPAPTSSFPAQSPNTTNPIQGPTPSPVRLPDPTSLTTGRPTTLPIMPHPLLSPPNPGNPYTPRMAPQMPPTGAPVPMPTPSPSPIQAPTTQPQMQLAQRLKLLNQRFTAPSFNSFGGGTR